MDRITRQLQISLDNTNLVAVGCLGLIAFVLAAGDLVLLYLVMRGGL